MKAAARDSEVAQSELVEVMEVHSEALKHSVAVVTELRAQAEDENGVATTLADIRVRKEEEACHLRSVADKLASNRRLNINVSTDRVARFDDSKVKLGNEVATFDAKLSATERVQHVLAEKKHLAESSPRFDDQDDRRHLESEVACF